MYLDAFVPAHGDSVWGPLRGTGRSAITLGEEWLVNGPVREFDDPVEAAWMAPRRTPQPEGGFTEPLSLARPPDSYLFTRSYRKFFPALALLHLGPGAAFALLAWLLMGLGLAALHLLHEARAAPPPGNAARLAALLALLAEGALLAAA